MDFGCTAVPIDKITTSANGVREPLCNDCVQIDCTNPIKMHTVSIMGKPSRWRLWQANNVIRQVVQCDGYVKQAEQK